MTVTLKVRLRPGLQLIRGLRRTFRLEAGLRNLAPDIFKMVVCQTVAGELLSGSLGETTNNRPDVFGCASFEACRETFKNKPERVCLTWLNVLTSHRYSPLPFPLTNATCKLTISYQNEIAGPKGAFLSRLAAASWTRHTSRGRPGFARPPASPDLGSLVQLGRSARPTKAGTPRADESERRRRRKTRSQASLCRFPRRDIHHLAGWSWPGPNAARIPCCPKTALPCRYRYLSPSGHALCRPK